MCHKRWLHQNSKWENFFLPIPLCIDKESYFFADNRIIAYSAQAWRYLSHFSWFSSSSFHPTLYVSCEFKATKQDVLQSYQTGGNLALQVLQHKSPSRRVIVTFMDLSPTFEVWHLGLRDGCKLLPRWWPMPHWSNSAAWTWCQTNYQPDQIFMSESFKNAFNEVGHAK